MEYTFVTGSTKVEQAHTEHCLRCLSAAKIRPFRFYRAADSDRKAVPATSSIPLVFPSRPKMRIGTHRGEDLVSTPSLLNRPERLRSNLMSGVVVALVAGDLCLRL